METSGGEVNNGAARVVTVFDLHDSEATVEISYTVNARGDILVENRLTGVSNELPFLPRLGNNLVLDDQYRQVEWYGRGPWENYRDRKTGAFVAHYEAGVEDLMYPYIRPQENGYRTDVRRVAFLNKEGNGIAFLTTGDLLGFNAHHQHNSDFDEGDRKIQRHTFDVPHRNLVNVNVDYLQMGVGGDDSWGARPHLEYMIPAGNYRYGFLIRRVGE